MGSHSRKVVAITAYGSEEDRLRAQAVAQVANTSTSKYLLETIQTKYRKLFGDMAPAEAVKVNQK
jgi:hypothetical protein